MADQLGPIEIRKASRRIEYRFPVGEKAVREALKSCGAHFQNGGDPHWWIGITKSKLARKAIEQALESPERQEKVTFKEECDRRRAEGLVLKHRKTYDLRDEIKAAGGVWDAFAKAYLMPNRASLDEWSRRCNEAANPAPQPAPKVTPKAASKAAPTGWRTFDARYSGTCCVCGERIHEGSRIHYHKQHGARHESCEWVEVPADAIVLSGGSGYGCNGWAVGQVLRNKDCRLGSARERSQREIERRVREAAGPEPRRVFKPFRSDESEESWAERLRDFETARDRRTEWESRRDAARVEIEAEYPLDGPEFLCVVRATQQYVREDGLSFGVGDESGYSYVAWCRAATDEEAAPIRQQIAEREAATQRQALREALWERVMGEGTRVECEDGQQVVLDGEEIYLTERDQQSRLYGGGRWFVLGEDRVYAVRNNGHDGDDWRHNTIRTGGAGAYGAWIPRSEVEDLSLLHTTTEA